MQHPVYLPAATIQPGNLSYRPVTPVEEDEIKDESSDLDLDDAAYAAKIAKEIGLGEPTDQEKAAMQPVLLTRPQPGGTIPHDSQDAVMTSLRDRLKNLTRTDRFRATNLYAPPNPTARPPISAFPLTGPSIPPPPPPQNALGKPAAVVDTRYYALPPEPPMASVPVPSFQESGARVDRLIQREVARDRVMAEQATATMFGDQLMASASGRSGSTIGQSTLDAR